ncbi:Uncharacterised protein [Bordetella pertussis]|nr:Uncharacterised protein [Bordetella pertussis]
MTVCAHAAAGRRVAPQWNAGSVTTALGTPAALSRRSGRWRTGRAAACAD